MQSNFLVFSNQKFESMADVNNLIKEPTILIITFIIGATVLGFFYISNLLQEPKEDTNSKCSEKNSKEKEKHISDSQISQKSSKKKHTEKWKDSKQNFSHAWLVNSFKGHSGQVLDMDFSSNNKYLATCGEEEEYLPGEEGSEQSSSGSEGKENTLPDFTNGHSNTTRGLLSRRQRKNRQRKDEGSPVLSSKKKNRRASASFTPLEHFTKLNMSDVDIAMQLFQYLLTPEELINLGFPVESFGRAIIYVTPNSKPPKSNNKKENKPSFDVNAREFFPTQFQSNTCSSNGYCDSYLFNSEVYNNSVSMYNKPLSSLQFNNQTILSNVNILGYEHENPSKARVCVRCERGFFVTYDGEYLTHEQCIYHWGKLHQLPSFIQYTCCRGSADSRGCSIGKYHVWNGYIDGINGPYDGYIHTRQRKTPPPDGNYGVYALDCEMCYTANGLDLVKVTIVGTDGRVVYDTFVKPDKEIIDYNTRFSGINPKDFRKKTPYKSLKDVQNDLMGFINADTILIGHGLENDLRALKIIHTKVIDTSIIFPHFYGLPYRRSLKSLTSIILKHNIQDENTGHDSVEDSRACLALVLWLIRKKEDHFL